jgi:hypothetical protein
MPTLGVAAQGWINVERGDTLLVEDRMVVVARTGEIAVCQYCDDVQEAYLDEDGVWLECACGSGYLDGETISYFGLKEKDIRLAAV